MQSLTFYQDDDFDFKSITYEMIRLGFLVKLPFRLRLGKLYQHSYCYKNHNVIIALSNKHHIPNGVSLFDLPSMPPWDELNTDVLILFNNPKIDDETLEQLRKCTRDSSEFNIGMYEFFAMEAINHFVMAYGTATTQLFGGKPMRLLKTHDFVDYLKYKITIFSSPEYTLTEQDYNDIFSYKPKREILSSGQLTGDLGDLGLDGISDKIGLQLKRQINYVFYEFAFEAKSKMVVGDYVGALLLAVAALEGAHAAFVQYEFTDRLKQNSKLAEDYVRELGMTLCNTTTPLIFMNAEERPSEEDINKGNFGIRIRNEIMHSLKNSRGEYRIKTRNNREINDAYSGVMHCYLCYVNALEKRNS